MIDNLKELLRQLQGKIIRLDFNKADQINDILEGLKNIIPLLPKAYSEKGYPVDVAKELTVKLVKNIATQKSDLSDIKTFEDAKKNISIAILDLQKEFSS